MKRKTIFLSTALAGALAAASAAQAATDVKVYSSNACQAVSGTEADNFKHSHNQGFFSNAGVAPRFVVCPIVRDNHTNLNGVKSVGVRVSSPNGTTLSCFLQSFTALGGIGELNQNSTTSVFVTNLPLDINTSTKNGTYSLFCLLPANGRIYGYRVIEFEI